MAILCPICNGTRFTALPPRPHAVCAGCGARERHRHLALFLLAQPEFGRQRLLVLDDRGLWASFLDRLGQPATIADSAALVENRLPAGPFDLVCHEHLAQRTPLTLEQIHVRVASVLAPGGRHAFVVPLKSSSPTSPGPGFDANGLRALFRRHPNGTVFDANGAFGPTTLADTAVTLDGKPRLNNATVFVLPA